MDIWLFRFWGQHGIFCCLNKHLLFFTNVENVNFRILLSIVFLTHFSEDLKFYGTFEVKYLNFNLFGLKLYNFSIKSLSLFSLFLYLFLRKTEVEKGSVTACRREVSQNSLIHHREILSFLYISTPELYFDYIYGIGKLMSYVRDPELVRVLGNNMFGPVFRPDKLTGLSHFCLLQDFI